MESGKADLAVAAARAIGQDGGVNIDIAYAMPGDVDELVDLFEQYRSFYGKAPTPDARTFLAERIETGQTLVLVARDGVGVVGFAQVYRAFDSTHLTHDWVLADLFVDGAARGRRVGGSLVEAVLDGARENGAHHLRVSIRSDDAYARRLYESRGFEEAGDTGEVVSYRLKLRDHH